MTGGRRWWPFAALFAVSLVLFLSPSAGAPAVFDGADKLCHAALFGALAVTGLRAWAAPYRLAALLVLYGAAVEVAQGVLPIGRTADGWDLLADALGVLAGLLLLRAARADRGARPVAAGRR